MFTEAFEKLAAFKPPSAKELMAMAKAIKPTGEKVGATMGQKIDSISKGLSSGSKASSWNPTAGLPKLKKWDNLEGVSHNVTSLGKQYAPTLAGAAMLGRATKDDNKTTTNNIAVAR